MNAWNLTGDVGGFAYDSDPWGGHRREVPSARDVEADALSVSQAAELAAGALHGLPKITVLGEVTGFRGPNARSGHCYFQIKDEGASLECIVWRGTYDKRTFDLRDGLQVLFTGTFDLYKPTGKMSFKASSFTLAGEGLLRQQVAQLAEKLRREGLMEPGRKRRIPVFCTRVAVVTSLSGAVIDDVKRTLRRRNPLVELVCVGAKVQGEGAPAELIEGLRRAAAISPTPDCILLVRGGGSFEDLMTFNDEGLARAVASCPVPVVTGIGHEPDNSICDMVSDRRCSTPTAAAESVAPALAELVNALEMRERRLQRSLASIAEGVAAASDGLADRLVRAMRVRLDELDRVVLNYASRPCMAGPADIVNLRRMELAQTVDRFTMACDRAQERLAASLDRLSPRLTSIPASLIGMRGHELELATSRLRLSGTRILQGPSAGLGTSAAALEALSPLKVLGRGYSIAYGDDGCVATRAEGLSVGDRVRIRMVDGNVRAVVDEVTLSDGPGIADGSAYEPVDAVERGV